MFHGVANNAKTQLNSNITSAQTSIVVVADVFPATPFYLSIGTEILEVTAKSGTTLTVVRGVSGTTPSAHKQGDDAGIKVVAEQITEIQDAVKNIQLIPGPQGPKGDTGAQGIQGIKGDKGDTGATGPGGANGTWDTSTQYPSLNTTTKDVIGAINETFTFASSGKTAVAAAITGKGVATSATDTFTQMAANITAIPSGGLNIGDTIAAGRLSAPPLISSTNQYNAAVILKVSDGWVASYIGQFNKFLDTNTAAYSKSSIATNTGFNSITQATDGTFLLGTTTGYLVKVSADGQTKVFEYYINHGSINKIIVESDGYVCLGAGGTGYLTKVNLAGTANVWDMSLAHSTYEFTFYRETDGYIVPASGYIMKISLDGTTKIFDKLYLANHQVHAIMKETDGYVLGGVGAIYKVALDGSYVWNASVPGGYVYNMVRESDGWVCGGAGYLNKVALSQNTIPKNFTNGTYSYSQICAEDNGITLGGNGMHMVRFDLAGAVLSDKNMLSGITCLIKDTDGYVLGSNSPYFYKYGLDGTTLIHNYLPNRGTPYSIAKCPDGGYLFGCVNYVIKMNSDLSSKMWEYNTAHTNVNAIYVDTDGFIIASSAGYVTKLSFDGATKAWDLNLGAAHVVSNIIKDTDGYVCSSAVSTAGYLVKVSLDGTTKTVSATVGTACLFVNKASDGYDFITDATSYGRLSFDFSKTYFTNTQNIGTVNKVVLNNNTYYMLTGNNNVYNVAAPFTRPAVWSAYLNHGNIKALCTTSKGYIALQDGTAGMYSQVDSTGNLLWDLDYMGATFPCNNYYNIVYSVPENNGAYLLPGNGVYLKIPSDPKYTVIK